ncbi:MAG: lauroyl acyltransferase [Rhodospirillales bacterium]|nr:lauroyl acyltransferase [Rhodospirillales bacterium]
MKRLRYAIEAAALQALLQIFALLPVDTASSLGGWIGRTVGPRLAGSRKARRNLERSLPDVDADLVLRGMYDNLGRVVAEYPHLGEICDPKSGRVEMIGGERLQEYAKRNVPVLVVGAHIANWEVPAYYARHLGVPLASVYRAPNNPWSARILDSMRAFPQQFAKGPEGARGMIKHVSKGGQLGVLIDQKMNDGVAVEFFGRDAMTAPAVAQLARKYKGAVVPMRIERLGGARFRITFYEPLQVDDTGDRPADDVATMRRANAMLEDWIRERPEQWLWLHRRWPD